MKGVSALLLMSLSQTCLPSGNESVSPCLPQWTEFRQRCFVFYPVWSTWSSAKSMCSQAGGDLVSLHSPEETQFIHQLVGVHTAVWLGGFWTPQNDSWFWSDGSAFRGDVWTRSTGKITENMACMEMTTKSGEVNSAPCGELRFYICSSKAKLNEKMSGMPAEIFPGVSLFDVILDHSSVVMKEILHWSSILTELRSGHLSESCLTTFVQQEAFYLHRVSSTLEVLIGDVPEEDQDMRSLLLDIQHNYKTQYSTQVLLNTPPSQMLLRSLLSFHSVVLDAPEYLLTALAARATLHTFIYRTLLSVGSNSGYGSKINSLFQQWRNDILTETALAKRYRYVIEKKQNEMHVYKAINIFREHMMNQMGLHKAVDCTEKDDEVKDKEDVAPPLVEA